MCTGLNKNFILALLLDTTQESISADSKESFSMSSIQEPHIVGISQPSMMLPSQFSFLRELGRIPNLDEEFEGKKERKPINILDFKLLINYIQGYFTYFFIEMINKD